jgi:predicted adenine nucleotide alpha hydrolase (AANH) superfamily ATPase
VSPGLLVHACCGPCSYFPLKTLIGRDPSHPPLLFFFNPNIQPASEYQRRRDSLAYLGAISEKLFGATAPVRMEFPEYRPREFFDLVGGDPFSPERCRLCYRLRLRRAAEAARDLGAEKFSTTLLYSRQQRHDVIREEGERAATEFGVGFHYEDFRVGHKEGQLAARGLGLYRQSYCGCVYGNAEGQTG